MSPTGTGMLRSRFLADGRLKKVSPKGWGRLLPPWILNQELGFAFQVVSWRCIFFIIIFLYMLLVSHVEEEESWSCCRASLQGVEGKHFKYNLLICFAFFFFFLSKNPDSFNFTRKVAIGLGSSWTERDISWLRDFMSPSPVLPLALL